MSNFNENSRVKIPALLHLARLGFKYISLKDKDKLLLDNDLKAYNKHIHTKTNIFIDIFAKSLTRLNPHTTIDANKLDKVLGKITEILEFDDKGEAFYNALLFGLNVNGGGEETNSNSLI